MPDPREDPLFPVLDEFLLRISFAVEGIVLDSLVDMDLSFTQVRSLFALAQTGEPIPINELADRLRLSVATAGRAVDHLVALGLADRREDTHDRRIKRVSLSDSGRELAGNSIEAQRKVLRQFSSSLPRPQSQALVAALGQVLAGGALRPLADSSNRPNTTHLDQEAS